MKTSSSFTKFLAAVFLICSTGITLRAQFVQHLDYSLGATDYMEAGMPSRDADWTAEDWQTAMDLLFYIAEEDKYALPRYQSEFSGDVFADLFDVDMPARWKFEGDFRAGLEQVHSLLSTIDDISVIYFDSEGQILGFLPEFLQVMFFNLELHKQYHLRVDELGDHPALYLELSVSPEYNIANVEAEMLTYIELVSRVLISLEEEHMINVAVEVVRQHGLQVISGMAPLLSDDALYSLRSTLQNFADASENSEVQELLEAALALLPG